MVPRVENKPTNDLATLSREIDWRRIGLVAALETCRRCRPNIELNDDDYLEAENAAELLTEMIQAVESEILLAHGRYGYIRWLWYLRRLPDEMFEGSLRTTLGYGHTLADALISKMSHDTIETRECLSFPIDKAVFRHISRLIGRVKLLSTLHVQYRRIGKGGILRLSKEGVPYTEIDGYSEISIKIYDQRHDICTGMFGHGMGINPHESHYSFADHLPSEEELNLLLLLACKPFWHPALYPDAKNNLIDCEVETRHVIDLVNSDAIFSPFVYEQELSLPYIGSVIPICQLLGIMPVFLTESPLIMTSLLQAGYFLLDINLARRVFDSYLEFINVRLSESLPLDKMANSFTDWCKTITKFSSSTWPPIPGQIVRQINENWLLVDIKTATEFLFKKLQVERTDSEVANIRADYFEIQCQKIISETKWAPNDVLSSIRGVTLRKHGEKITDIDAIGAYDNRLLIISCKSLVYDDSYDKGDYKTIRNAQSTVDKAVEYWNDIVARLNEDPIGDNYNFSDFSKIIGIVCTPFVVYSNNENTLSYIADDLRSCVSSAELSKWLNV